MAPDGFKLDAPLTVGNDDTGTYVIRTNNYTTANLDLPELSASSDDWRAEKPAYPVIGGRPKSEKEKRKAKLARAARRRNRRR